MRRMASSLLALAVVGLAVPSSGANQPRQSWGKANVSLADYRKDAIECGRMGHYVDVSDTPQAKALAKATRRLESADDHGPAQIGEGGVNLSQVSGGPGGVSDVSKAEVDSFAAAARYAASSERIRSGARSGPPRRHASAPVTGAPVRVRSGSWRERARTSARRRRWVPWRWS